MFLKAFDRIRQDRKHQSFFWSPLTLLSIHFEKAMRSENVRLKKSPEADARFRAGCFVDHRLPILRRHTRARSTPEKNRIPDSHFAHVEAHRPTFRRAFGQ